MKKLFFLVLILISIYSCNQSKKHVEVNSELVYAENLKKRCVHDGDNRAYGELIDYYGRNHSEYYELLPISIIMADKYNNDNARISIFYQLIEMGNKGRGDEKLFFKLDNNKQHFIIKYLMDGAKNKDVGCLGILDRLIKNGLKIDKSKEKEIEDLYIKTTTKT